jgi:formylglycine-generating enzyme required for sulfatase activity
MKLKLIPAGEFLMGAADDEPEAQSDEKPQHKVRITRPFYLGVFEVTQKEYKTIIGTNPSHFSATGGGQATVARMNTDGFPVENVSWLDATAFCNKLSEREGLKPCYWVSGEPSVDGTGYRMPTEAEWEYACRAGTITPFAFGTTITPNDANFNGNATYNGSAVGGNLGRTTVVGSNRPNAFGLHDMHGNVWEWCQDWYVESLTATAPLNSVQSAGRVIRGGGWSGSPQWCRSADRSGRAPGLRNYSLGFRVARVK